MSHYISKVIKSIYIRKASYVNFNCRVSSFFQFHKIGSDNAMISVYPFCDEVYAFSETTTIYRVNLKTLETEEKVDVGQKVSIVNHTSHPHVMKDGNFFSFSLEIKIIYSFFRYCN